MITLDVASGAGAVVCWRYIFIIPALFAGAVAASIGAAILARRQI